jgi:hypothetical protein
MDELEVRARNTQTVTNFYDSERTRDLLKWESFWHEGGRQRLWLSSYPEPVVGRSTLVQLTRRKFEVRPPYGMELRVEPLADPKRVLARLRLILDNSVVPKLDLWCMFHFDADGLITELEEIFDASAGPVFPE